jgi:hypothetical protein
MTLLDASIYVHMKVLQPWFISENTQDKTKKKWHPSDLDYIDLAYITYGAFCHKWQESEFPILASLKRKKKTGITQRPRSYKTSATTELIEGQTVRIRTQFAIPALLQQECVYLRS